MISSVAHRYLPFLPDQLRVHSFWAVSDHTMPSLEDSASHSVAKGAVEQLGAPTMSFTPINEIHQVSVLQRATISRVAKERDRRGNKEEYELAVVECSCNISINTYAAHNADHACTCDAGDGQRYMVALEVSAIHQRLQLVASPLMPHPLSDAHART